MHARTTLRLGKAELAVLRKAAKLQGRSLNNWAVRTLLEVADQQLPAVTIDEMKRVYNATHPRAGAPKAEKGEK